MMDPNSGFAPLKPSYAKTAHDRLKLPGGREFGAVDTSEAVNMLMSRSVAVTHEMGRDTVATTYAAHLQKIHDDAGAVAVENWLKAGTP